jgi:nicotinate-nucleotide adenylyltransferase
MNIALIGGSFNPPHIGHLLAACYVRATQEVDRVWLMPADKHPFGKVMVDFEHRLQMCRALCADATGWLEATDVERRAGKGWTVDTLAYLAERRPADRFTLVIGSDIVADLPKWKEPERLRTLAHVLVLSRAGHPVADAVGPPLAKVSSTEIREALARGEAPADRVPRAVLHYIRDHGLYAGN